MIEGLTLPVVELVTISILTEGFVQIIKGVVPKDLSEQGKQIMAILISIAFCVLLQVSIFTGMPQSGVLLGSVLAGIIASRGSNFIHDLIGSIGSISAVGKKK